jgi:hypothetical protein
MLKIMTSGIAQTENKMRLENYLKRFRDYRALPKTMSITKSPMAKMVLALMSLGFSQLALAWSSKDFPLFEPVHQIAIDVVLKGVLNVDDLQILQEQQVVVDEDQAAPESYEHSMTGVNRGESYDSIQKTKYIQFSEDFIRKNITAAIALKKMGDRRRAMEALGKAMHPLEDATSPAHEPFQAWHYNEGVLDIARHIRRERIYPNIKDKVQIEYKARLEGVVRWAYDIFLEKISMPPHFFNADGMLQIPAAYLH